jgi:uncharacterized protein (DUF1501 family)
MKPKQVRLNRRAMIRSLVGSSMLLPGILSELLAGESKRSDDLDPLGAKPSQYPAKAKRVIFLYATGGVSHIDTFDPKSSANGRDGSGKDKLMGSQWAWSANSQCGTQVTDLFPHMRNVMDEVCLIRSTKSAHFDHSEATLGFHTGSATFARPSFGSWVSYGLGTLNRDLPSYIVVAPFLPYGGTQVYANDFLPAYHQGTRVVPGPEPIANLNSPAAARELQELELGLADAFNRGHLKQRQHDSALAARIKSFETAFQMQQAAPEAFDISKEPTHVRTLYGLDKGFKGPGSEFAWQCLVARRLAERGVRFIELIDTGSRPNWDSHGDMKEHERLAYNVDQPMAALILDLKQRGMLEDTLILWATEFGRTPAKEGKYGRGHHGDCFSIWMAGGGVKCGIVHGETDDIGAKVMSDPVEVHDVHATVLHLLGIDHEKLTYRHAGRDYRLTDVHGRVMRELLV